MLFNRLFAPKDLWAAAKIGDTKNIQRLVASGHDPNQKQQYYDAEGATPLHVACAYGHLEAIKLLISLGAKVDAKDNSGSTPLIDSIQETERPEVIDMLLDLGANINAKNKHNTTALDVAAFSGYARSVALLLNRGATPDVGVKGRRSSPVARCVQGGHEEVLKQLIAAGADVNAAYVGDPPLVIAGLSGHVDLVKLLLDGGADPNLESDQHYTPLMSAVAGDNIAIVKMLLNAGAVRDAVNTLTNETALDIAENRNKSGIAEYLRSIGAKRAKEMPPIESRMKEESDTFWQLPDDSTLSVNIDPWPFKEGNGKIKVEVSETYDHSFSGIVEYRVRVSDLQNDSAQWVRLFDGKEGEDGSVSFSDELKLFKGVNIIEFRISNQSEKDFVYPEGWKIEVE